MLASSELTATYVSGAVALLAIISSLVTTALTLRHQRTLAEEGRISDRRADAYIRLIEHQHEDPAFEHLLPPQVASRLLAYGSEEVNNALGNVRRAANESDESFKSAIDDLLRKMRCELQRHPDSEPLHALTRWQH